MVKNSAPSPNSEPRAPEPETDWRAVANSTVDPPVAGQQDQPDEPTPTDGSTP